MSQYRNAMLIAGLLAAGATMAAPSTAFAAPSPIVSDAPQPQTAAGGEVGIRWNRDLANDLGIRIKPAGQPRRDDDGSSRLPLQAGQSLRLKVESGYLRGFASGALQARGGFVLSLPGGSVDLRDFRLVPRAGAADGGPSLDLVGGDGVAWFQVDRAMHELLGGHTLAIPTADLRISQALARRLGRPEVAGWTIGELQLQLPLQNPVRDNRTASLAATDAGIHWDGDPAPNGGTYRNDLFMLGTAVQYSRCSGCSGEAGSGRVVFTPSSTLKNNVNQGSASATVPGDPLGTSSALYAAGIPWYSKFSGNFAPYGNDQHPYLTWNMYRLNADGSIEQIGRAGIKHAFLTTNGSCLASDDYNSHVLGRGCVDTYSVSNNDYNSSLSPRSEILPDSGRWGRCGSSLDANCDGVADTSPARDDYYQRLIVGEAQIAPSRNAGASWLFESWYLARGDINIYNSMSTRQVTPQWSSGVWNLGNGQERLGSALDRWYAAGTAASQRIEELVDGSAHAKVAVKVIDLGNGQWRYHYAVMNFDFSFAATSGAEPNLRILSNQGFDGFGLDTGSAAQAVNLAFRDGDLVATNDWQPAISASGLKWSNPAGAASTLWWGTLYSFSLTTTKPPVAGTATLYADGAPTPRRYTVATLVPGT